MLPRSPGVEGCKRRCCVSSRKISRPSWTARELSVADIATASDQATVDSEAGSKRGHDVYRVRARSRLAPPVMQLLTDPALCNKRQHHCVQCRVRRSVDFNRAFRRRYGAHPRICVPRQGVAILEHDREKWVPVFPRTNERSGHLQISDASIYRSVRRASSYSAPALPLFGAKQVRGRRIPLPRLDGSLSVLFFESSSRSIFCLSMISGQTLRVCPEGKR